MPGRPKINATAPFRSSVADAAFAVEERLVWGGADLLKSLFDAVKWPFERIVWRFERGVVWPLEERTDEWSVPARATGVGAMALLAAAAGVLGLVLASGGGSATTAREVTALPVEPAPVTAQAPAAPVLHGAAPDFTPEAGDAAATTAAATTGAVDASGSTATSPGTATSAAATEVADPGKEAIKVARRFSDAFVLYETGKLSGAVRSTIAATATPQVTRDLLRRPPRLPANVTVPKAKVLNVVPGPKRGDVYTVSVSLLRVGITSELRLGMQREKDSGEWQVTETLG
jgi:hypothetical protein